MRLTPWISQNKKEGQLELRKQKDRSQENPLQAPIWVQALEAREDLALPMTEDKGETDPDHPDIPHIKGDPILAPEKTEKRDLIPKFVQPKEP